MYTLVVQLFLNLFGHCLAKVKYKKCVVTWIKILFWIPADMLPKTQDLIHYIEQLEKETGLELCGIPSSNLEVDTWSSNPFFCWLRDCGRTPYLCHMPSTMDEIGEDFPALHVWQNDTQNFQYVEMRLC